jgi:Pyruvate/2-oxoacid:ferredoxin oxidoreductase gamma subunit
LTTIPNLKQSRLFFSNLEKEGRKISNRLEDGNSSDHQNKWSESMHTLLKDSPGKNMVMLGALVQTGTVPLWPELFRQVLRQKTKPAFVEMNLKAFDLGSKASNGAG